MEKDWFILPLILMRIENGEETEKEKMGKEKW